MVIVVHNNRKREVFFHSRTESLVFTTLITCAVKVFAHDVLLTDDSPQITAGRKGVFFFSYQVLDRS